MKRAYFCIVFLCALGILGYISSEAVAIEAYFDTEVSTKLDVQADTGTLLIRMLDEEVPPILQDVAYEQSINVEIIFDASKTMEEPDINGIRKLDIARKLVSILVDYFPQRETSFALRVNGAKYSNNCLDSELVIPFSKGNGQKVLDMVKQLQVKGLSPLSYSIRQLLQDFAETQGTKIVFVITDGQETCDVEPADACSVTMDLLLQAEFEGSLNILGINTVYDDVKELLSCLATRGNGEFLDSNRNNGKQLAQLIWDSSQLGYSISRILDPETLAEGKILGLLNRRIGDSTELALTTTETTGAGTDVLIQPGIIQKEAGTTEIKQINVVDLPKSNLGYSTHELPPGIYKIEFSTVPPLLSYFTIDQQQELTVGVIRSGPGFDLYDRAHLALGNRYYDRGQFTQALAEYQKVIDFNSRDVDAHLNMGIIYQDILQDNEKAAMHYKTYLDLQGPRQDEAGDWLREVRGLPPRQTELERMLQEREEQRAQEEQARRATEEEVQRQKERQQVGDAYNEILTANPSIVSLAEQDVVSANTVNVTVSVSTTDLKARDIALDVGNRIQRLLNRTPSEIRVYRQNRPDTPIAQAAYDHSQQRYIIMDTYDDSLYQQEDE